MGSDKLAGDIAAWSFNVFSSVALISINKEVMSRHGFIYATSLTGLHFLATWAVGWMCTRLGYVKSKEVPFKELALFSVAANASIVFMNMSLLYNSVGFYQIAKLSMMPFVCILEYLINGKSYSRTIVVAVAAVFCGVATVTISDVSVNFKGLMCAIVAVVSTALQQIYIGSLQKKHSVSSFELLSMTAAVQVSWLLPLGPFLDAGLVHKWVFQYDFTSVGVILILLSCLLAVCCNLSQYLVIGRFSATTFQVMGHMKTVLVIGMGWLGYGEVMTMKMVAGILIAIAGMVAYSWAEGQVKQAAAASAGPALAKIVAAPDFDDEDVVLLKSGLEYTHGQQEGFKDIEMAGEVRQ